MKYNAHVCLWLIQNKRAYADRFAQEFTDAAKELPAEFYKHWA